MRIWEVPERFRPENRVIYPKHQTTQQLEDRAELWFRAHQKEIQTNLVYCPIKWTAYHIQSNYGKDRGRLQQLQNYISGLPKHIQFFTIVQYDDGILVDLPNCIVFSAGGKPDNAIPIPLVCDEHKIYDKPVKKEYIASFVGDINTHPIRKKMVDTLVGTPGFYFDKAGTIEFEHAMQSSYFALCPRGYGKTSFRLYEAIQMGCIPVYISDEHWLPANKPWSRFCVIVKENEISSIPMALDKILKTNYDEMKENCEYVYKEFFTYDKTFEYIKECVTKK